MPPGDRVRGFFKRAVRGAQKLFKPGTQEPTSQSPSPSRVLPPDLPSEPAPSLEPVLPPSSQLPTLSQELSFLLQPKPNPGELALAASPMTAGNDQPASAETGLSQATKKVGADVWTGLKFSLRLLERSSDAFPPIKAAVGGFLAVIDIFEIAAQNQKDYVELASNLQRAAEEFAESPGEHTSSRMSDALGAMKTMLEKEIGRVDEQRQHLGAGYNIGAWHDALDAQEYVRRVETLRGELQDEALVKIWRAQEEQVDTRLQELPAALKATYNLTRLDPAYRHTRTFDTREPIKAKIRGWADDPDSSKVYCLSGMAGVGKTTLAYSFCDEMQRARRLGASFFCSRNTAELRDVTMIVPTIAHQLARLLPSYREVLIRQIGENKDIGARRIARQFKKLIRDPLLEIQASVPPGVVVTVDALDECDRRDGAQDILNVLFLHARDLPIKFLVTCRPEPGLFDTLQSLDERDRSVLHLHDIDASIIQADITTFLEAELASLALPREKIKQLAKQAGPLFIYAATAVRYIHPLGRRVNSHQRLADVLSMGSKTDANEHAALNSLYTAVLSAPFTDEDLNPSEKQTIRLVLDTVLCAKQPMSVSTMTELLGLHHEQEVISAAHHLGPVLYIPESTGLITTFHASFLDFMLSREHSGEFCCNFTKHNQHLALSCLNLMERTLRFNICGLESSFIFDQDVTDLDRRIDVAISTGVSYACLYWGDHLAFAETWGGVSSNLEAFLSDYLLFWMEVLNLKGYIHKGVQILRQALAWFQKTGSSTDLLELADDSVRFVMAFDMSSASRSTPHIYISALPFWPPTRPVSRRYRKYTVGLHEPKGLVTKRRGLLCLGMRYTADSVLCVAFSPDGARIASGSGGGIIHVWDMREGFVEVRSFKGHKDGVNCVSFSSEGAYIISGSSDRTIRVWDAHSGLLVAGPFKGHSRQVRSVAFSRDGTCVVSGSDDCTIRVWDTRSGLLVAGPFEGHMSPVYSVAFSPDGRHIVSGSGDSTIRIWDALSGLLVAGPHEGHANSVYSVAFSSDGTRVVSGSGDCTIRVWDARSGLLVVGPFKGHTGRVRCVAFSPDGTCIVSGSDDRTIRVWDARSGLLVAGPFEGHTGWVYSVSFSPDATLIISGSGDQSIRIWEARNRLLVAESFGGHTGRVRSVSFSPDGTRVVSGSDDCTIRVWDAYTGFLIVGPFEGHTNSVYSVAFSSDGTRIVSGSDDHTIRVWDARSGLLVAGPFKGHTGQVRCVAFSYDNTRIVSGSEDHTIRVWDAHTGLLVIEPLSGHTGQVRCVAFSSDGTCIVSGSEDHTICLWDAYTGLPMTVAAEEHTSLVHFAAFSPDMPHFSSRESIIPVWDETSKPPIAGPFKGHTGWVYSVAFSPDSTRIVSGSGDGTVRIWDVRSGLPVAVPFVGHTNLVSSVTFSPDGTRIASSDNTTLIWDARTGLLVAGPFEGQAGGVNCVAFSPDGTRVVSGSDDMTIRVWDVTPRSTHESGENWSINKEGVITGTQGQLLLCVPPEICTGIMRPQNSVCMSNNGSLKLDFSKVMMGSAWAMCYDRSRTIS